MGQGRRPDPCLLVKLEIVAIPVPIKRNNIMETIKNEKTILALLNSANAEIVSSQPKAISENNFSESIQNNLFFLSSAEL
jgi:hypothetical protein